MVKSTDSEQSFWAKAVPKTTFNSLMNDITVDVAVVGGGIAGLTCAYLLKQSGLSVAVLEKNTIGSGTTGGTTGKVTSQHGLMYADLEKRKGKHTARLYGEANQAAIARIEKIIKKEKIDCDWQRQDNFIYTTDIKNIKQFKTEARIAKSLGLPASFETNLDLPLTVKAAVKFSGQALFNAKKYTIGLAKAVDGQGSYVFEHSNVTGFRDGSPAQVKTETATVTATNIIVATKVPAAPLIARLTYAALEYPHTSYIVAGEYKGTLKGMYISPDDGQYSILPVKDGKKQVLFVGGENHIPGLGRPRRRQRKLADYAKKHFGVSSIAYRWKAMDYIAYDKVPLVGKVYPWSKHLYTVTGFKKWGLTTSMVAATILHDEIMGKPNPMAQTFRTSRLKPVLSIPRVMFEWFRKPQNAAWVFGTLLVVAGISGFCPLLSPESHHGKRMLFGLFEVQATHNFVHLASGTAALLSSVRSSSAKIFFQLFGIMYGLVAVIGIIDGGSVLGLFHINLADNLLHVAIAATSLYVGFRRG